MARLSKVRIPDGGRWFVYYKSEVEGEASIEALVGSTASPSFKKKQRELAREHLRLNPSSRFSAGNFNLSDPEMKYMQIELGLELLYGWRGIETESGTEDKHTVTRAREVLEDPEFGDFLEWIHECSANLAAHAEEAQKEAAKNSQPVSSS